MKQINRKGIRPEMVNLFAICMAYGWMGINWIVAALLFSSVGMVGVGLGLCMFVMIPVSIVDNRAEMRSRAYAIASIVTYIAMAGFMAWWLSWMWVPALVCECALFGLLAFVATHWKKRGGL